LTAGSDVETGSWVKLIDPEPDQSGLIYYVIEMKSPFGENEKYEDSQGYRRICQILPFEKSSDPDSDGKYVFVPLEFDEPDWGLCRLYSVTGKPALLTSSVPAEYAAMIGN